MKNLLFLGLSLAILGVGGYTGYAEQQENIDYSQITTENIILDNGIEITSIEIPNEYVDAWKEENNWNDNITEEYVTDTLRSIDSPEGITPYGPTIPLSSWDISSKGKASINGSFSNGHILYSNYNYYGYTKYKFELKNTGASAFKYQFKELWNTYYSSSLASGKTTLTTFSTPNKSYSFYLRVEPSSTGRGSLSGYINKG
ncbi:hypothetical protein HED42_16915 [Enterococcus casseliflavus]|uniref:hypothetical protein n=1 Tax=Enterococcus casseliflavus TaxID=37734 RepID=UPI0014330A23|nr:hypothetical protein [Enterococcus casseliflavus]NKD39816.1 hypothetical protein [Enterococcus casseliflavus]